MGKYNRKANVIQLRKGLLDDAYHFYFGVRSLSSDRFVEVAIRMKIAQFSPGLRNSACRKSSDELFAPKSVKASTQKAQVTNRLDG
jgi:hypothetical protein